MPIPCSLTDCGAICSCRCWFVGSSAPKGVSKLELSKGMPPPAAKEAGNGAVSDRSTGPSPRGTENEAPDGKKPGDVHGLREREGSGVGVDSVANNDAFPCTVGSLWLFPCRLPGLYSSTFSLSSDSEACLASLKLRVVTLVNGRCGEDRVRIQGCHGGS